MDARPRNWFYEEQLPIRASWQPAASDSSSPDDLNRRTAGCPGCPPAILCVPRGYLQTDLIEPTARHTARSGWSPSRRATGPAPLRPDHPRAVQADRPDRARHHARRRPYVGTAEKTYEARGRPARHPGAEGQRRRSPRLGEIRASNDPTRDVTDRRRAWSPRSTWRAAQEKLAPTAARARC